MANETTKGNIYEQGLDKNPANHKPLTPLSFLDWAARVFQIKLPLFMVLTPVHGLNSMCAAAGWPVRCRNVG